MRDLIVTVKGESVVAKKTKVALTLFLPSCLGMRFLGFVLKGRDSLLQAEQEGLVVVSAAKYKQPLDEAPASITILTSKEIKGYGWRTLADLFRSVRGFYISDDRNYSYLGIRGF